MRGIIASLLAFIVLFTLLRVYPGLKTSSYAWLKESRNLANVAAWVMFNAACEDVDYYLRAVNASQPLPNMPSGIVVVWCNETPVVRGFSWSP
jgi:hypothetical protein